MAPKRSLTLEQKEAKDAYRRKWRAENKEKESQQRKTRRAKNKDRINAAQREYRGENAAAIAEYYRARRSTPRGRAGQLVNIAQHRARQAGLPLDITIPFILKLVNEAVALGHVTCEHDKPDTASLDQIVAGAGYVQTNVQIVPAWYNYAKHDFKATELLDAMSRWRLVYGS